MRYAAWLLLMGVPINEIDTVEINTFGEPGSTRTALIYRNPDTSIVDWKWASDKNLPVLVRPGLHVAAWRDGERLYLVRCRSVRYTRTLKDQEVEERKLLPDERRQRLK